MESDFDSESNSESQSHSAWQKDEHDREWKREVQPLDFSPSSGSVGNNNFPHGPTEHDGSAKINTTFRPYEAGPDTRNWNHMNKLQDGKHAGGDRDKRRRHADQKRDLQIFSEQVKLTQWEKNYASHLLQYLHNQELDHNDGYYGSGEALVLAVITFSSNKNDRRIRPTDEFTEIRNNCNVSKKEIRTVRKNIREFM